MRTWVLDQLQYASTGLLATNVPGFISSRLGTGGSAPSVTFCTYGTNQRVLVTVTYNHPVFFPLLGFATDAIDGTPDGSWTLSSSAQMRLEHPFSTAPTSTC